MSRRALLAILAGALAFVLLPVVGAEAANGHSSYRAVCPTPPTGYVYCHELVVTDQQGNPLASTSPTGLDPSTIKSVYSFSTSSTVGAGQTIAIVDAYDDPSAENDLNVFSSQYGLPACTTANGCFQKVNQSGGTSYPRTDSGWALEISLDVQWAHAIAPGATILLVEASTNSFTNLLAAEDYAKAHAKYVSNSWGGSEFSGESSYDSHFVQSGVSFFVSAGDSGLPAKYPSASPNVISVGGTTLHFSGSTFTSETGWSSGGGGCSSYETATSAQSSFSQYGQVSCGGKRATPDVSLDADPNSGVSVYDSTPYSGQTGWFTVGGTSASSPMWAARSADQGSVVNAAYVYGSSISYRDITQGNNGAPCLTGYDLCTGRGSWTGGGSTPPPTATAPVAPTLSATAGDGTAHLSWTTPSDGGSAITGYNLYRGTSPGGEQPTPIATLGTVNSYDDTGLVNGTTYYYTVTAINSIGESAPSNEVNATPQAATLPPAPTGLTAVPAKGKGIQLSWNPSSDSSVTSYFVYRSLSGVDGSFTVIASTSSTSYKDAKTTRGTTYYYEVTAVNAVGQSPPSSIASATAK